MKLGILTFHSQLNYGGVLQCWALQTELEKMGNEVVVIDRWLDEENFFLEQGYNRWGWRQWVKFGIRSLLGLGDLNSWLRVRRTKRFIIKKLRLTPYHFVKWKEAPKELGVDMFVVGSDQVWHCGDFGDPRPYLLEDAPAIPAMAYAASFGMTELPERLGIGASDVEGSPAAPFFKQGLAKFKTISCREREGVEICKRLDFDAVHVVDPTLLAWGEDAEKRAKEPKREELVCYFLSERIEDHIVELEDFARKKRCKVKVFLDETWLLPFPSNLLRINGLLKRWKLRFDSRIEMMDSAGPEEFMQAFSNAKWVVSDSFHALMFAICDGCDARMIRPTTDLRRRMFARIEEFAKHTQGPLVVDSVPAALDSLAKGEKMEYDYKWLRERIHESQCWLQANLK